MKPVKIPSNQELEVINNLYPVTKEIKDSLINCYKNLAYPGIDNICIDAIHKYESDRDEYGINNIDDYEIFLIEIDSCDNCSSAERRDIVIELLESTNQNFDKDDIPEFNKCTIVIMDLCIKGDPEYNTVYTYYYLNTLPIGDNNEPIELVWLD